MNNYRLTSCNTAFDYTAIVLSLMHRQAILFYDKCFYLLAELGKLLAQM